MDYKFTIIIPVYNEEGNLLRVEKELLKFIQIASQPTCILFINDGSTDKSQELIDSICHRNTAFHYISFNKNKGLSTAIKAGFDYVQTELIGYIDADLQTTPTDFNKLLQYVDTYHLVTGIRVNRKDEVSKKISSKIANTIRNLFTKDGMLDTGCPLKVIKTSVAKQIPMFKGLHRFLPAMVLLQGGRVYQTPVQHFPRVSGKTKFGISNRLFTSLIDCFVYLWIKKRYISYHLSESN